MKNKVAAFRVNIATPQVWKVKVIAQHKRRQAETMRKKESGNAQIDSTDASESSLVFNPSSSSTPSSSSHSHSSSGKTGVLAPSNTGRSTLSNLSENTSEQGVGGSSSDGVENEAEKVVVTHLAGVVETSYSATGASVSSDQIQNELDNLMRSSQAVKREIGTVFPPHFLYAFHYTLIIYFSSSTTPTLYRCSQCREKQSSVAIKESDCSRHAEKSFTRLTFIQKKKKISILICRFSNLSLII